jgi:23S rRNA (adenine2503-C2)-methyltransferase
MPNWRRNPEAERHAMFNGNAHTLRNIGTIMRGQVPMGRKWTLNFAVAGYEIDPDKLLAANLDPDWFICKLTPMHKTAACVQSGTKTEGDYTAYEPYQKHEEALKAAGYDVLVFIASREEDEGRITCGNAILSGTEPFRQKGEYHGEGKEDVALGELDVRGTHEERSEGDF